MLSNVNMFGQCHDILIFKQMYVTHNVQKSMLVQLKIVNEHLTSMASLIGQKLAFIQKTNLPN